MKTVRYKRTIVAMLMLLMYGAGDVWAQSIDASSIIINVMPSGTEATSSATATEGNVSATVSERVVTLTVTPASGYYIKASDIVVEPLASMGRANAPRRGGVMDLSNEIEGTLYNHETGRTEANVINSVSYQNTAYYVFELPTRYDGAYVTATFTASTGEIRIPNGSSITYNANGHYILENDIAATALEALFTGSQSTAFSGTFEGEAKADGTFPKITGATHALLDKINGGKVKNVMLDNVFISSGTNVGAICNEATGNSRIYNCGVLATNSTVGKDDDGYDKITSCSSTISGSGYVGGIVGLLDGSSRVINCFSYANVSGGSEVGGIVGHNNVATTSSNLQTMVMNCMFYGEISGSSIAPIYNGEIITNDGDANGVNNFNYFRLESSYIQNTGITKTYNCALGAETRFLQRFEFYRNLLNSNRELAAWWATGNTSKKDDIAKWVLDKAIAPYPILKKQGKYPSIINYDPEYTYDSEDGEMVSRPSYSEENRNKGAKIGTLDVRINNVGSNAPSGARIVTSTLRLVRTDKDYDDYNFNFDKIQLPYYNEVGIGNYTGNKVVTGWKITSITGGTQGSYSTGADVTYDENGNLTVTPYNFADRKCTNKDLFSESGRVFNQGAYWDVPEGVTSITIEPYWGKAVYLADAYWDVIYKNSGTDAMATATNVPNVGGVARTTTFNGQVVFTFIEDAISSSKDNGLFKGVTGSENHTVYDYAVVLVGNYHHTTPPNADNSKPYTVTSVDLDGDNEPDYSFILRFNGRTGFHPVRYDFLNLIGLGMAQKTTGGTGSYNLGIMQPKYWFEVTNTALFRVTQFEYSQKDRVKNPYILQGGVIEQWVTQQENAGDKVSYFHVGGNVWFKEFHRGSHQDNAGKSTPHPPVSVTGGDFNKFYLTGLYQSQAAIYDDNAECYISGGRFGEVAGAGMEGIGTSNGKGNITWIIDHADIKEFYGGGINYDKPVHGNIHTIIKNSHVTQFCGGPKFGDMEDGRTVKTVADNCTFGTFFGAGYGGNSYNRYAPRNHNDILNFPHNDSQAGNHSSWNNWLQAYYKQDYSSTYKGVSTQFDYQFLPMSGNLTNVARIFVEYVAFSLATTHNVTSDLTGCIITGNYYGGGSLGKVDGDVTSTLTNCSVEGNVFGAGFSGSIPTVEVMNTEFITEPYYYTDLGTYRTAVLPSSTTEQKTTTTYHWQQATATEFSSKQIDKGNQILYTTEDLTALGTVTGKVTLNIEGNTLVKGNVTENNVTTQSGGVFGGGDASAALGDTEVNIDASSQQAEGYNTYNVFGGGNKADVGGSVVVNMKNGVVNNDVYGGGALANTNIGNVTAGYGTDSETIPNTTTKTTTVNLQGGTIYGDAYGGGLGRKAATGIEAVEATVYGDITVNLGDADASVAATAFNISNYTGDHAGVIKSGRVFGANNLNGSPKGDVTVNIYKTVTGNQSRTDVAAYKKKENETGYAAPTYEVAAVYGGGNLADYTTTGKTAEVNIWTCDASVESVYGGGNAAAVPSTQVTVYGAYEIHYVFGGGNGKDPYTLDGGSSWTPNHGADVTSNASTVLTGGFIHEAYGASNEKGTIGRAAALHADDAGDSECALDVWKLVGAGKNADFFGDVNLVLGCMPEAKVDAIYGGADNANVFGNVTLTVTSGNFGAVYGGNNLGGIINGQIILNIEETGCRPINIDKLYLGGNQAAYSKYGYYVKTTATEADPATGDGSLDEEAILTNGKLTLLPRTSADDVHKPVKSINGTEWILYDEDHYPEFTDPILNVRSFTSIGEVFGGGYGTGAVMYANPTVNINQTYGKDYEGMEYTAKATGLGTIGDVYGGGDAAAVQGITTVNIGTETTVDFITEPSYLGTKGESLETAGVAYIENTDGTFETKVQGAIITGNVYGGGKLANVKDITNVNIGAKDNGSGYVAVTEGAAGVTIAGNVYGGGKGKAAETGERAFFCEEAMVGEDNLNSKSNNISSEYANHGTHVRIGHGKVNGSVYGGGEMGRVEFHTEVTIGYGDGTGSDTKSPVIDGYVYGAGKGAVTHGYSGLVRGNSKVTIQGDAKVGQSVYGGGEKASVGKYLVVDGLPQKPLWGGVCTVTIQGYAEIGPDDMQMVTASGKPDDTGHVFGAGAGVLPYENVTGTPYSIQPSGKVEYDGNEDAYLTFIKTLGLASNTDVTIGGHAFVKGSVYGGSENGYVQENTHVTIAGGQVGNGDGVNKPYTDQEWVDEDPNTLKECAHWPYQAPYAPYDIYKDTNNDGKPDAATDGHTFYGNVFGGGRGYYPYAEGPELTERQRLLGYSKGIWLREAGSVGGNTVVDITGGHILTSVYGGNEMTDVTGNDTINMVGGTVGVPRTVAQMQAHPVTCYVFGAGKGDQRVNFNQQTNVASTQVNISGTARIYGSTFGGGEDGHVIGDVETNIGGDVTIGSTTYKYSDVIIGTTGTSSVDGNIFGGGRGFSETALTAGVVCGDVRVNIHNGKILGSVFGGGRLASVGTYLTTPVLEDGSTQNPNYGKLQEDTETGSHGHTYITIDGGTIGATDNQGKLVTSDYTIGDVFGGGKGSSHSSSEGHLRYGEVKTTSITMNGGKVNGSVYGGGEIATVEDNTTIAINGGEIGDGVTKKGGAKIGNVYGGGKGSLVDPDDGLIKGNTRITISETDKTNHPTIIYHNIYGGGAYGSVGDIHRSKNDGVDYVPGRDEDEKVLNMPTGWENTGTDNGTAEIIILGGQIGTDGDENGMVFGSSRGDVEIPTGADANNPLGTDVDRNDRTAWVFNTKVEIGTLGSDASPEIRGSVYGSGENGHVFDDTEVKIHSGKIGVTESDDFGGADYRLRGNVYGGGCGEDSYTISDVKYYNPLAGIVLGNSKVTIDGGHVVHNVYGAGALGSVGSSKLNTGGKATIEISGGQVGVEGSTGGSVFGAARGNLDIIQAHIAQVKETKVDIKPNDYNDKPDPVIWNDVFGGGEAGIVTGSVAVTVSGGEVKNDVYGGGALANTNTDNWDGSNGTKDYYIQVYGLTAGESSVEGLYTKSADTYNQATGTAVPDITYYYKTESYTAVPDGLITVGSTDVSGYYIIQDNNYISVTGTAEAGVTYYQQTSSYSPVPSENITVGTTDVSIYYTKTPGTYSAATTSTATAGVKYYKKKTLTGSWATDKNDDNDGTTYKTTLTLIGGTVGNAYGGGLGDKASLGTGHSDVEAMVYGDVMITVGDGNDDTKGATAFTRLIDNPATTATGSNVYKTGHLYGANNINGTPTGNVSVNIYKTAREDGGAHQSGKANSTNYEIQGVYGGGNLADYTPVTGKQSNIYIDGCDDVSIEFVYGGGNSASVPSTNVNIVGCWEIGYAFGGGNGNDKILHDDGVTWYFKGADVNGDTHIDLHGGTIHWAFGGSNRLGDCIGTIYYRTLADNPYCPLKITTLYGAGQNADFSGDLNLVIKCPSNSLGSYIENVFGGSLNAKIGGNITMTIIGGIFNNVFGGNDQSGSIGGNITINIQETSDCQPIFIQNLYGGGNQANYPGDGRNNGSIQINVKSCTNIGNIFGGGHEAEVDGNTEVNINMIKGSFSGQSNIELPIDYDVSLIPNVSLNGFDYIEVTDLTVGSSAEGYYTSSGSDYTEATGLIQDGITYYKRNSIICTIDDAIGTVGNVYAGGDQGVVTDNSIVNIGTLTTVTINNYNENNEIIETTSETVLGAHITGNVFGGGNLADVTGNTYVNIGAKKVNDTEVWESVPVGSEGLTIAGNVYGGGKGAADNFECDKAMVGTNNNYGANNTGSTYVHIGNGTIGNGTTGGNVYGGGMIGRVEANTNVTVGFGEGVAPGGTPTSAPVIYGSLYGAGQGVATHGYSGLVRGNSTVTIMGNTKLMGSVYGGGQKATVGRFWVKDINNNVPEAPDAPKNTPTEMPYAPMAGGTCTVTIGGYAEIGPDDMVMNNTSTGKPDDLGHVFGAGKGLIPYEDTDTEPGTGEGQGPGRWYKPNGVYTWQSYANNESDYLVFVETFALVSNTYVTIRDNAFIKGSVYGGSENGRVLSNTSVTIQDNCQIGNGYVQMDNDGNYLDNPLSMNRPYSAQEWTEGRLYITNADRQELQDLVSTTYYTNSLPECNSWPYQDPHAPYDRFANASGLYENGKSAEGGRPTGSDGRTFYGNVFGGGSGYYPYKNDEGEIKWHWEAGAVGGNITVVITGGHILTNIYGGNEMTNVGKDVTDTESGKCTIEFGGTATLGVPRTLGQIKDHPVTCYLFGAGKGDPRVFFNKQTNVNDVDVKITGGKIYGSVFGGGEDGHVMRDVAMTIGNENGTGPTIGTWGTSYVDGNVFGGGRGFSGEAQTAGTVGGNVTLNIKGGTMLGSVYGGGRLASVGTMFEFPELDNGDPNPEYGNLKEDDSKNKYGHVTVNISGGTIGNENATGDGAVHSGNVFGGSMGRLDLLDGTTRNPIWPKMAQVKSTAVNISGNAEIIRSVYGGGELGTVRDNAYVTIGGTRNNDGTITKSGSPTIYRDVYGGGYGSEDMNYTVFNVFEPTVADPSSPGDYELHTYAFSPMQFTGCVGKNTYVNIVGGRVKKSVYGGGELASVGIINCRVDSIESKPDAGKIEVGYNSKTGYYYFYQNMVKHSSIKDDGAHLDFGLSWPYEFEYVPTYDGKAHVHITGGRIGLTDAEDGENNPFEDKDNGDVCGGGKGKAGDFNDYVFCANVGSTEVHIEYSSTPAPGNIDTYLEGNYECITGAVYGGAENGHVMGNTKLTLEGGLVGHSIYGGGSGKGQFKRWLKEIEGVSIIQSTSSGTAPRKRTNDKGEKEYEATCYSITAGKVFGNTEIEMTGGYVVRNVYGGGNMGSVGKGNYSGGKDDYSASGYGETLDGKLWDDDESNKFSQAFLHSGRCKVTIIGGTIGYIDGTNPNKSMYPLGDNKEPIAASLPYGNVFGGCRGMSAPNIGESPRYLYSPESFMGYANETEVIIGRAAKPATGTQGEEGYVPAIPASGPTIYASVYGGGQDGHVRRDTKVIINKGDIGIPFNTSNKGLLGSDPENKQWLHRGNVYGAGSGIGEYEYDFNYDGDYEDRVSYTNPQTHQTSVLSETDYSTSAGSVTRSTYVEINDGIIYRNVYGGGSLASIGAPKIPPITVDQYRKDNNPNGMQSLNEVIITGGQIGDNETSYDSNGNHVYGGHVFGASRGQEGLSASFSTSIWTDVTISGNSTIINGDVYGGGERGAVKCGVDVNMLGGTIKHSIYGGGALANTNTSNWGGYAEYSTVMGKNLKSGDDITGLYTKSTVGGRDVYTPVEPNSTYSSGTYYVLTWAEGKEATGKNNNAYHTNLNILGGAIGGEAYGGGLGQLANSQLNQSAVEAIVYGDVTLNLNGLDNNPQYSYSSKGATVHQIFGANNLNGTPKGHVKVHVFATQNTKKDYTYKKFLKSNYDFNDIADLRSIKNNNITESKITEAETALSYNSTFNEISDSYDDATTDDEKAEALLKLKTIVLIAAAKELGLSSAVAEYTSAQTDEAKATALANIETAIVECPDRFDIEAVYGGGNLAEYIYGNGAKIDKTDKAKVEAARTEVIIDGCYYTSIKQVYGGGNAASASGTFVEVNAAYEIDEVFGGGNGADNYYLKEGNNTVWYENPGANVGYHNYTHITKTDQTGTSKDNPHHVSDNSDALSATDRQANYAYGSGIATTNIRGGTIHTVYGGSNKKGNISTTALSVYEEADDDCPININETYGGGKDAPMDGEIDLTLDCVKDMDMIFGGAKNADVNSNITLNITNGRFKRVFGGNNTSGAINGSITVNIEETGCVPIEIDELYGGGYLAPYSIYGYEKDADGNYNVESVPYIDNNTVNYLDQRIPLTSGDTHNNDPRINIISATRIGTVYGGGYQAKVVGSPYVNVNMTNGKVEVKNTADSGDPVYKDGHDTQYTDVTQDTDNGKYYATLAVGTIDTIFGGGNLADIVGDTHVEIGTGRWVTSWDANGNPIYETVDDNGDKYYYKVETAAVTYGSDECTQQNAALPGAITTSTVLTTEQATRLNELLSLSGDDAYTENGSPTQEHAEAYNATLDGYITTADVKTPAAWAWYGSDDNKLDDQTQPTPARYAANIRGDVFGGGKGKADNFTCDKAMIGIENEAADPAKRNGGTNVIIANGTVGGSVYGGGMIGRVEKNTAVTIGFESGTGEPVIEKDVFGAGMGIDTHGYAGLVRGNSSVIIQGKSKVRGSVYGGGMQASLGRYFIATTQDLVKAHNVEQGMPYDLKSGGKATVTVQGSAEIGPDDMLMTAAGGPRYTGHVFGAGKGTVPYSTDNPGRYTMSGWESYSGDDKEAAYIKYIETLGITNETEVTVGDSAFIKGSVYGGGENGFVLKNTHVTIQDNCQIGNGLVQMADDGTYLTNPLSMNRPYSKEEWTKGKLIMTAADRQELRTLVGNSNYTSSLPECSSWPYQTPYAPYDKFADADGNYPSGSAESTARGGRSTGSDGHTFYGNVFGGGSGYYPYKPGKWHDRAGSVGGNTVVEITGGHILTSVYGGNELTNVDGSATVTMKGGTLGVPRTLGQIAAHPINCYLFGAGKGDMRTFFNTENNVASALVTISDSARIYGSVFGGGEDGHVLGDVTLNISDTAKIGTTGTSYVDGNVFGAGRGFNGEAITAGSVGGNIVVNISGGTMLGSVYGGGRLASVGIGFNAVTDADYGQFTDDTDSRTYGHITVNISGGTIGNDLENQSFAVDVDKNGKTAQEVETAKNNGLKALKVANKIPNTDFELYDSLLVGESTTLYKYLYRTVHTKGGNVYGGSMGRLTLLDNSFNPVWPQLGQAKSTTVNITGGTIKSNVYGGGEMGTVRDNTYVTIGGNRNADGTVTALGSPTIYRDVYGGGYGSTIDSEDSKAVVESTIKFGYTPLQWAGIVGIGTEVNIYGGWVKKSVYGGGEMASVGIINYVLDETEYATEADVPAGKVIFRKNPATQNYTVYANIVKHTDESNSFALSWPYEFEYIPQYTGTAKVNIRGGRIGITGKDFMGPFAADGVTAISPIDGHTLTDAEKKDARMDNGDVFGGGKGLAGDRYEMAFLANVGSTEVTIDYQKKATKEATPTNYKDKTESGTYANDCITGSVYAGAENGHVMGNTQLTLKNGLVGHAIYGGGKGKGTYTQSITRLDGQGEKTISIYSITAGKVYGNTKVDITGGYVVRNVYGGGNMGSVGKGNYAGGIDDYSSTGYGEALNGNLWDGESLNSQAFLNSGKTEVTITGGTIGYIKPDDAEDSMKDGLPYGNVFGGCRGESAPNIRESPRYHYSPQFYSGYTNETKVTIGTESGTAGPTILGSVYGGGQDGHVRRDASVTIYSGEIGRTYSADALNITDPENPVWLHRGNVYGAGSGIGKYQYDFNYDGDFDDDDATYNNKSIKEQDYSTSAGSVTRFTNVEINGGKIHRNVYGGGSLASVGAPKIPPTRPDVPYIKGDTVTGHSVGRQSLNEVIINGGTIGDTNSRTVGYGGNVYGASRGLTELGSGFATSVWTKVEANSGHIYGNVFGGGEAGSVTMDSKVIIGGKVENTNSGSGAPRRTTPAVQPDAAAPANTNSSSNSSTVTPANVATEAPDARSIRINRAQ